MAQSISNIHPDCQPAGYLGMLLHRQPPLGLEPVSNMRIRGYLDGEVGLLIPSRPPGACTRSSSAATRSLYTGLLVVFQSTSRQTLFQPATVDTSVDLRNESRTSDSDNC